MPKEVLVDDPAKVQTIGEASQVLTLEGDDRTLSLEAVLQPEIQDRFQPCDKKIFTALVSRNVFWVKFKVTQIINEDIWLHIESAHIRELDLYLVDSRGKLVDELHTGVSRDLENKAVDLNTFFFPLQQRDQTGEYTCYIRVISLMSLELPFRVGTFEELTNQNVIAQGLAMAFLGLMLMMILYNAFLYGLIKEKIYLLYTIHLVLAMVSVLFISNHIIFRDYAPTLWMHDNFAFWVTANYISTNVFSIHYLRLKSNLRWVYLLLLWTIPVFILIATLGLFFPTKMIIPGQILSVIDGLAILGAAYYLLFNHKAPNIAFTLGYTAGIISLIVTGGVLEDWIPYTPFTRNILLIGIPIEVLLFSIGLGERFNALRKGELDLNTNLKRFNVELEASNESLDQFNYHVSHDLKTVLNNTHSLGVMIRKYNEKQDFKKIDEVVDRLLQAALSGTETVDSFLSVSSTNVGLLSSELSKINVAEQIHSILKKHELEDQVRINFEKMQFKQLNMNAQLFESLIVNLVSNSIKYCDTAPVVNLQLLEVENAKIIRYQDNGVGIDLNKHGEMLFKPFKRLLNKEGARGSGVGLHLVQRIVSASNGHIKVESTVGKGTMFVLSFLDNDQEKGPIEIKTL